jgi:drug/metabolite transporter (DMT)-like permease
VPVDLNDWILALHLLSAFALVGAQVLFTILIVAGWRTDNPARFGATMRAGQVGAIFVGVGTVGTIVFGVWLAISLDAYQLWDGWVLAALVLWAVATELGRRTGDFYREAGELARSLGSEGVRSSPELAATTGASSGFWFHIASVLVTLLILLDMIWKPGA